MILETLIEQAMKEPLRTEFDITAKDYVQVMKEHPYLTEPPRRPSAPVNYESSGGGVGLFSVWSSYAQGWDHHAPEYLKALEKHEAEMKRYFERPLLQDLKLTVADGRIVTFKVKT